MWCIACITPAQRRSSSLSWLASCWCLCCRDGRLPPPTRCSRAPRPLSTHRQPGPERKRQLEGPMSDRLVIIASYASTPEAQMAKNLLEAEGIPAFLAGELSANVLTGVMGVSGEVRLQVRAEDAG